MSCLYFHYFNIYILLFVQTERAVMLDEIVDYVKFLRLQVKVKFLKVLALQLSRLVLLAIDMVHLVMLLGFIIAL